MLDASFRWPGARVPMRGCIVCAGRGGAGRSEAELLALFGYPIAEPATETGDGGTPMLTQWFERARFELHPELPAGQQVQLGRLGAELLALP